MKILSFSAVEILPALLDRSKTQTIRPLWDTSLRYKAEKGQPKQGLIIDTRGWKEPRFKAGEQVGLMWKQRGTPKGSWFCSKCGNKSALYSSHGNAKLSGCCKAKLFPKILGEGIITEVFEIVMGVVGGSFNMESGKKVIHGDYGLCLPFERPDISKEDLAKRDGFKSETDMFNWFDKEYKLYKLPKRFIIYRWKWI